MQEPPLPVNEASRISSLVRLDVLDTPPEERFDRITRLAQHIFDVPIALISLVDKKRQWFKSKQGLEAKQTCRKSSFCAHAITMPATSNPSNRILEVHDTLRDQRFHDNPLVVGETHIRFYAGFVLQSHDEHNLGTLCIIDREPKQLSSD
ncbi:MAG: GAF domain-containing protein [Gammaproteobacteria bacterium]